MVKKEIDPVKRLDKIFSLYIRLRDIMPNGMGRCISCGKIKPYREFDCGHFFGRANMATRYDEDNCSAECQVCNRQDANHLERYRANLIKRIGEARFAALNERAHSVKKWDDSDLNELIQLYTHKVKRLSREKGVNVSI